MELKIKNRVDWSIEEYLRLERDAEEKHEYRDGEILAMAGGSYNHSVITSNLNRALGNALEGKPCRPLDSNLRVRIPRTPLYTYPDVSVVCGPPQFDPDDPDQATLTNPRLIVEVLSPSTEGYDRGDKFTRYRKLESLTEYVLVSQVTARVEVFLRQGDGTWRFSAVEGVESRIQLASLAIDLPLAAIYRDVTFPAPLPQAESR